jgi:hypothetical protein
MQVAARAAMEAGGVPADAIDSVCVGNVIQSSADAAYVARHVALRVGCKLDTPSLTINRLCGSGFQSIVNGAQEIMLGESSVVLTGMAWSQSNNPFCQLGISRGSSSFYIETTTNLHLSLKTFGFRWDREHEPSAFRRQKCQVWCQAGNRFEDGRHSLGRTDGSSHPNAHGNHCRESGREIRHNEASPTVRQTIIIDNITNYPSWNIME